MKKHSCVVPGCDSTYASDANVKFHQLPKDEVWRKRWMKAINRTESEINKRSKVCSKHFRNNDYSVNKFNYGNKNSPARIKYPYEFKTLKSEAVPTLNLPPKSTFKIKISKKDNNSKEIKVEEVQLKEEKVTKMPKKHHIDVNPPRPRTQSRRAASKEALKQMQLLLDDDDDTVEIPDDDYFDDLQIIPVDPSPPPPPPPKKKYKLSHRKSSDGNDRDVIVLKSITNRNAENTLELDCWVEQLEDVQKARLKKMQDEERELQAKLDLLLSQENATVVHKSELSSIIEVSEQVQSAISGAKTAQTNLVVNSNPQSFQLVVDPRLGLIVSPSTSTAPVTPSKVFQGKVQVAQNLQQTATTSSSTSLGGRGVRTRRAGVVKSNAVPQQPGVVATRGSGTSQGRSVTMPSQARSPATSNQTRTMVTAPQTRTIASTKATSSLKTPTALTIPATRQRGPGSNAYSNSVPSENTVEGGLNTGGGNANKKIIVDLTTDDSRSGSVADSKEISFNKLQGKTYPSLVVVARPHLRAQDVSIDRPKLDAKVKTVLMHAPTKFTEWLIQQGLIRSEPKCSVHTSTPLKLGMYSDVSKFPYSGGYVWISECCPRRFVSVFSGSLFEGSPHPPMVILKLLYHWACQTNIQNVTQWVKVDNLYVKGMFTWLRSVCTVGLHTHARQLGGPGVKVEVGVISLGTTSQDGNQRQVKVEVLGVLETTSKLIRLRAVEPQAEGDRNYKKRFSKILEPIYQWVHPQSTLIVDLTVDYQTLIGMGFTNVVQASTGGGDASNSNKQIMEYLRRIVPRMFQNTLSLLSRQIIQQFLDELVWREWFGVSSLQAFDNLVVHLAQQTKCDSNQSLIVRLNKVAQNPFKNHGLSIGSTVANTTSKVAENVLNSNKKQRTRKPDAPKTAQNASNDTNRPPKSTSPDLPEQMVPLENYYYGTIETYSKTPSIVLNMKCPFCKLLFDNNIQLMNHLFKHAHNVSQDAQLCRYCLTSVATANDLLKHIATSHPAETKFDNGFICLICETQYMNPFVLGKHMSKEHCPSELPYQCGTCGYRCSNHKQAIDHFHKAHDNGPTIQCPFCLKSTTVFTSSRNIVQNMNYFIQHLQKHQRKQFAKRCGKCNLWFVQKDVLKDHQQRMHASQRGRTGLIPWMAPRNGVMVPKSRMDKYPGDGDVINFGTLHWDLPKDLLCKECHTPMASPKHFPSFESCQNPNCQYSTCCTNAMQEHNAKCSKSYTTIAGDKLPFEMFCICGYSDTDGNQMSRHLAICERKSAYPSKELAKSATVTHSMLDVLGLVRKPDEAAKSKRKPKSTDDLSGKATKRRKTELVDDVIEVSTVQKTTTTTIDEDVVAVVEDVEDKHSTDMDVSVVEEEAKSAAVEDKEDEEVKDDKAVIEEEEQEASKAGEDKDEAVKMIEDVKNEDVKDAEVVTEEDEQDESKPVADEDEAVKIVAEDAKDEDGVPVVEEECKGDGEESIDDAIKDVEAKPVEDGVSKCVDDIEASAVEDLETKAVGGVESKLVEDSEATLVEDVESRPVEGAVSEPVEDLLSKLVDEASTVEDLETRAVGGLESGPTEDAEATSMEDLESAPVEEQESTPVEDLVAKTVENIELTPVEENGSQMVADLESKPSEDEEGSQEAVEGNQEFVDEGDSTVVEEDVVVKQVDDSAASVDLEKEDKLPELENHSLGDDEKAEMEPVISSSDVQSPIGGNLDELQEAKQTTDLSNGEVQSGVREELDLAMETD